MAPEKEAHKKSSTGAGKEKTKPHRKPQRPHHISRRLDADRRLSQAWRIARVLRVFQVLQQRRRLTARQIAQELECSERTVYRDLNTLELVGIHRECDPVTRAIQLLPGYEFPELNLSIEDLLGLAVASTVMDVAGISEAGSVRAITDKLAARSAADHRELLADAQQLTAALNLRLADHSQHRSTMRLVQWALIERRQVAGRYQSPRRSQSVQLTLHPYRLCLLQQAWYLVARPADEPAPKTYRIARFTQLKGVDAPADIPPDFDLRNYLGNAWAVFRGAESFHVELKFMPDAVPLVTETRWHHTQQIRSCPDGTAILSFDVDGLDEIVWWVLGWSGRVEVLAPPQLRQLVAEQLRQGLKLNGHVAGGP